MKTDLMHTQVFRAPRELVLQMFSQPELLTQWWGPFGFSTTTHEMRFEPGGTWRLTMHGPEGTDHPNLITYSETGPDRIAYKHVSPEHPGDFHVVITLEEKESGKTTVCFQCIFPSPEELARVVDYGAGQGLVETMTRLDALLAETQSMTDPFRLHVWVISETEIKMVRSFRARQAQVFEAFTRADYIRQWMAPHGFEFLDCTFDARVGGQWSMSQRDPSGKVWAFHGEVLEIDPSDRLVSTFNSEDCYFQTNTTVFEEVDGLTRVTTTSSFSSKEARDGMLDSGMEWGIAQSYDRLESLVHNS